MKILKFGINCIKGNEPIGSNKSNLIFRVNSSTSRFNWFKKILVQFGFECLSGLDSKLVDGSTCWINRFGLDFKTVAPNATKIYSFFHHLIKRAHFPQLLNLPQHQLHNPIKFFFNIKPPNSICNRCMYHKHSHLIETTLSNPNTKISQKETK